MESLPAYNKPVVLVIRTPLLYIWEVALFPAPGTRGRPLTVVVSAPNSQAAAQVAVQQHRGYVAGPIRKVSNF